MRITLHSHKTRHCHASLLSPFGRAVTGMAALAITGAFALWQLCGY